MKAEEVYAKLKKIIELDEGIGKKTEIDDINISNKTTYSSEKIVKEIEILTSSQSLEYEGENITCENTLTSRTSDVVIKGQTYQNLAVDAIKNQDPINAYKKAINVKPNTTYTIILTKTGGISQINTWGTPKLNHSCFIPKNSPNGTYKYTRTTNADTEILYVGSVDENETNPRAIVENIIILEGDWTNKEIPASITGIESAGEKENKISILSHNKNYYPCKNDCIINLSNAEQNWFSLNGIPGLFGNIESKVDKDLIFFLDKGDYICTWDCDGCYAQLIKMDDTMITGQSGKQITVDKRTKLTFRLKNNSANITQFGIKNIMIRKVNANSTYEPYKGDKKEILLPLDGELKSLPNGVCDTIEQRTDGVYLVQRVGKVVFNGSEDWKFNNTDGTTTYRYLYTNKILNASNVENSNNMYCNILPVNSWSQTLSYSLSRSANSIFINNGAYNTVDGFKRWLNENNVVLYYDLATPIETKLDINNLDLEVYKDITHVTTDNVIQPVLSFKIPSNIGGMIQANTQNINKLYKLIDEVIIPQLINNSADNINYQNSNYPSWTNVKKALDGIIAKVDYIKPEITSFTSTAQAVYEVGQRVSNIVFNWTTNKDVTTQTLTDCTINTDSRTATYTNEISSNKTFTLTVGDGQNTASKSISIAFRNKIYYGSSVIPSNFNSAFILGLSKKQFATGKSGSFSITVGSNEYGFIAFPSSFGTLTSVKIGGFDTDVTSCGNISFTNSSGGVATYSIYRTGRHSLGAITMVIS